MDTGSIGYIPQRQIYFHSVPWGRYIRGGNTQFRFKIINGSANKQLEANSKEGEMGLAKKPADVGVLFMVGRARNLSGVLAALAEWTLQEKASLDKLKPGVELVCERTLEDSSRRL